MNTDKLDAIVGLMRPSELAAVIAGLACWRAENHTPTTQPDTLALVNVDRAATTLFDTLAATVGTLAALDMVARATETY